MINAFHLSDATPVALFGMFSLWAAASKRHWFIRTAVVSGAILAALLIPAYEVVVLLAVQSLMVVAGLAVWRRRRQPVKSSTDIPAPQFRLRLSMQTLMLAVVIVAVATAVAARTPRIAPDDWYQFAKEGVVAAAICLTCVWVVCGRQAWWIRLITLPLLVVFWGLASHTLSWTGYIVKHWVTVGSGSVLEYAQFALRDTSGLWYNTMTVAIGLPVLCAWLLAAHRARWFDPFDDLPAVPPTTDAAKRQITLARAAAVILFCLVSLFPLALFYRLMTPTPIPNVKLPQPNGYDDFIAAGKMIGPAAARTLGSWDRLTDDELQAELAKHTAAFERMQAGLKKSSWNPYVFKPAPPETAHTIHYLLDAMRVQSAHARRTGYLHVELVTYLDVLRLIQEERRGTAAEDHPGTGTIGQYEADIHRALWNLRYRLSAEQCVALAAVLLEIDRRREPWAPRAERRRILERSAGWKRRVQVILDEWNGLEFDKWRQDQFLKRPTELRILIVKLGINVFLSDTGRLPKDLAELVPKYLPAVPDDPFGEGPIKYRAVGERYTLYSVGPDRIDDRGQGIVLERGIEKGDLIELELFPPPQATRPPSPP